MKKDVKSKVAVVMVGQKILITTIQVNLVPIPNTNSQIFATTYHHLATTLDFILHTVFWDHTFFTAKLFWIWISLIFV